MGFTKLDEGIIQSSIMDEDPVTFKVWITLLAMCKENGVAYVSPVFLEKICRLTIDEVVNALDKLSSPDPHSRSSKEDGRRIQKVDMGFLIINYQTYRAMSLRGAAAEKQRLYRERKKAELQNVVTPGNESNAVTNRSDASASYSSSYSFSFLNWWQRYPRKLGKRDAAKAYEMALREGASPHDLDISLTHYIQELRRLGTEEKYIKHPATFLRAERWKDYLEMPAIAKQEKAGEVGRGDGKTAEYWAEVKRLKEIGLQGEELTNKMKEWEGQHGQGKS